MKANIFLGNTLALITAAAGILALLPGLVHAGAGAGASIRPSKEHVSPPKFEREMVADDKGPTKDELTLQRDASYQSWVKQTFPMDDLLLGLGSPESDPDEDGCDNLCEYLADSNPLVKDAQKGLNLVEPFVKSGKVLYVLKLTKIRPDVAIEIEHSENMEHWESEGVVLEAKVPGGVRFRIDSNEVVSKRCVRLNYKLESKVAVAIEFQEAGSDRPTTNLGAKVKDLILGAAAPKLGIK